jgi:hypothetical protein
VFPAWKDACNAKKVIIYVQLALTITILSKVNATHALLTVWPVLIIQCVLIVIKATFSKGIAVIGNVLYALIVQAANFKGIVCVVIT